jgi:hypothetical protein
MYLATVSTRKTRVLGLVVAWIATGFKMLVLGTTAFIGVAFMSSMGLVDIITSPLSWISDAQLDEKLRLFLPSAFMKYREFDTMVRRRKNQIILEIRRTVEYQLWRMSLWSLVHIRDTIRLNLDVPNSSQLSGRRNYKYRRSLGSSPNIRLLKLYKVPGTVVKCDLVSFPLQDAPKYDCISYTWGNSSLTHEILIDGCIFRTSETVYSVLRAQRFRWREKYLWVDSILH